MLSEPVFAAATDLVRTRTGLAFAPTRRQFALRALDRAMAKSGTIDPAAYLSALRTDRRRFDDLVAELTIGETYFFRHASQFELIRRRVLGEIRDLANVERPKGRPIRMWSAGCASGEEAYSLAILCAQEGIAAESVVVGSDISQPLLQKAREGVYGAWSLRGQALALTAGYLEPVGSRFRVTQALRRRVAFRAVNLVLDRYPEEALGEAGADLILCRNVLIYFDGKTAERVAARLQGALAPGGWLITGPSDPMLPCVFPMEVVTTEAGLAYRRAPRPSAAASRPSSPSHARLSARRPAPTPHVPPRRPPAPSAEPAAAAPETLPEQARALAASGDIAGAERLASRAAAQEPLRPEAHFLCALLLLGLGRYAEAESAARRVVYLDPTLGFGHLTLGTILECQGRRSEARLSYRNGRAQLLRLPPFERVALSDGELAQSLVAASDARLAAIGAP